MAHLLEHCLFMPNVLYDGDEGFWNFVRRSNGSFNGLTEEDQTLYHFEIHPTHLEETLKRFLGMFWEPIFEKARILKEIDVVEAEYRSKKSNYLAKLMGLFRVLINPKRPEKIWFAGSKESLLIDNIEERLRQLWQSKYSSHQMNLVVYSSQSLEELERLAQMFVLVPARQVAPLPCPDVPLLDPTLQPFALKWYGQSVNRVIFLWERDDMPQKGTVDLERLGESCSDTLTRACQKPVLLYIFQGADNRALIALFLEHQNSDDYHEMARLVSTLLAKLSLSQSLSASLPASQRDKDTQPPDLPEFAIKVSRLMNYLPPAQSLVRALRSTSLSTTARGTLSKIFSELKVEDARIIFATTEKAPTDGTAQKEPLSSFTYTLMPRPEMSSSVANAATGREPLDKDPPNHIWLNLSLPWLTNWSRARTRAIASLLAQGLSKDKVTVDCLDKELVVTIAATKDQPLEPIVRRLAQVLGSTPFSDDLDFKAAEKAALDERQWHLKQNILMDVVMDYVRALCGELQDHSRSLEDPVPASETLGREQLASFRHYMWANGTPKFMLRRMDPYPGETMEKLKHAFEMHLGVERGSTAKDHTALAPVPGGSRWIYAPRVLQGSQAAAVIVIQLHGLHPSATFWAYLFMRLASQLFEEKLRQSEQSVYHSWSGIVAGNSLVFAIQDTTRSPQEIAKKIEGFLLTINDAIQLQSDERFAQVLESFIQADPTRAWMKALPNKGIRLALSTLYNHHMRQGSAVESGFLTILFWPKGTEDSREKTLQEYAKEGIRVFRTIDEYPRLVRDPPSGGVEAAASTG